MRVVHDADDVAERVDHRRGPEAGVSPRSVICSRRSRRAPAGARARPPGRRRATGRPRRPGRCRPGAVAYFASMIPSSHWKSPKRNSTYAGSSASRHGVVRLDAEQLRVPLAGGVQVGGVEADGGESSQHRRWSFPRCSPVDDHHFSSQSAHRMSTLTGDFAAAGSAAGQSVWVTLRRPRGASGSRPSLRARDSMARWAGMTRASGARVSGGRGRQVDVAAGGEGGVAADAEDLAALLADDAGQLGHPGQGRTFAGRDQDGDQVRVDDRDRAVLQVGVRETADRLQAGLLQLEGDLERRAERQSATAGQYVVRTRQQVRRRLDRTRPASSTRRPERGRCRASSVPGRCASASTATVIAASCVV